MTPDEIIQLMRNIEKRQKFLMMLNNRRINIEKMRIRICKKNKGK